MEIISKVKALTFDLFGTVLDLGGSLTPYIGDFLESKGSDASPALFWEQWRYRQRIEQYQDTIMMLGHSGYLETARRGFVWTLKRNEVSYTPEDVTEFMKAWQELNPFQEVVPALHRLRQRFVRHRRRHYVAGVRFRGWRLVLFLHLNDAPHQTEHDSELSHPLERANQRERRRQIPISA